MKRNVNPVTLFEKKEKSKERRTGKDNDTEKNTLYIISAKLRSPKFFTFLCYYELVFVYLYFYLHICIN